MTSLYITQPDAQLSKQYEAFKVSLKQEDGSWKKQSIPAQTVDEVVLMGNTSVTGDALMYALELGMPVHYLSPFGKYLGAALPGYSRNGQLRLAQYGAYKDTDAKLTIVKAMVTAKIHNQYAVLYRHGQKENPLKLRKASVAQQHSVEQVRGIEGLAAREYFGAIATLLSEDWKFSGRNRRPPTDPMNALLSFGYALLRSQVTAAVHIAGLDPYIGYLHEVHHGQPAMVLDLMEEFRPLVTDNVVLAAINNKAIRPEDFTEMLVAYRLPDSGRRTFLQAFDRKMNDSFKHQTFGYKCSYRRALALQARLLATHLLEGIPYKGLALR